MISVLTDSTIQSESRVNKLSEILSVTKSDISFFEKKNGEIKTLLEIDLIRRINELSKKMELSISSLVRINTLEIFSTFEAFKTISNEVLNNYSEELELRQRDVFVSFYLKNLIPSSKQFLQSKDYIKDANGLYEYLLIDNQVGTEVVTSFVASATSSLQQFINGCLLGIEPGQKVPERISKEWSQNSSEYSVWAANLMLSLYPSNYIEPSLRQNKSEFFEILENNLSQSVLDEKKIQSAVLSYLNSFESVADLEVVSGYATNFNLIVGKNLRSIISQGKMMLKDLDPKCIALLGPSIENSIWNHITAEIQIDMNNPGNPQPYKMTLEIRSSKPSGPEFLKTDVAIFLGSFDNKDAVLNDLTVPNSFAFDRQNKYTRNLTDLELDNFKIRVYYDLYLLVATGAYELSFGNVQHSLEKIFLVSKTRSEPREYYIRSTDMIQSQAGKLNPFAWSDQKKIELPLNAAVLNTIRPVLLNNRLYVMYAEWTADIKKIEDKTVPVDTLKLMVGYQTFDGSWSAPQTLVSVVAYRDEFSDMKSFALQIGDNRCAFMLASNVKAKVSNQVDFNFSNQYIRTLKLDIVYDKNKQKPFFIKFVVVGVNIIQGNRSALHILHSESLYNGFDLGMGHSYTNYIFHSDDAVDVNYTKNIELTESEAQKIIFHCSYAVNGESWIAEHKMEFNITQAYQDRIRSLQANTPGVLSSMGCIIDESMNRQRITSGQIVLSDGISTSLDSIPALKTASSLYTPNMLQVKMSGSNANSNEIPNVTFEFYDDGEIGKVQYLQFDKRNFANYQSIRLNTSFVKTLVAKASLDIKNLLTWETQNTREPYRPGGSTQPKVDFNGANGKYFWELFFYLPFMIAHRLKAEGNYRHAMEWLKIMFNPSSKDKVDGSPDYWNIRPLVEEGHSLQAISKPSDPDALAASNPIHYKKTLFYFLLDLTISEADENYRILTPDSLVRAKQLYIQCLTLLGKSPEINLVNKWMPINLKDAELSVNEDLVRLEMSLLSGNLQIISEKNLVDYAKDLNNKMDFIGLGEDNSLVISSVFKIPLNTKLLGYWELIENRIYNLRHNLTITGNIMSIGLFASPMDPKDLLRARNSGSNNILGISRMNTKVPPYRFAFMLEQARKAVDVFCSFGERLLGFLENRDDKAERELDQSFSIELSNYAINLQQQSIAILKKETLSLEVTEAVIRRQFEHYKDLYDENLSPNEIKERSLRVISYSMNNVAGGMTAAGKFLDMAPNIFGVAAGGVKYSSVAEGTSIIMNATATCMSGAADILLKTAEYERRRQDWEITYKTAERELEKALNDIEIQKLQIAASSYNLEWIKKEQSQIQEKYKFLRKKFTNKELYDWLVGQMNTIYLQMYDVVLYVCLATEACYRFESGEYYMRFIQAGGWNNSYRGLNMGEKLKLNLEQMASIRWQRYERFVEIEKEVSLSEIFGDQWNKNLDLLKSKGEIVFDFPESFFAKNCPGHFYRQIYYMSFNMIGPVEQEVSVVLTQVSNVLIHAEDTIAFDYLINGYSGEIPTNSSYLSGIRAGQQVMFSKTKDDYGIAGIKPYMAIVDSDRFVPFEGCGLISKWHLAFTDEKARVELLNSTTDIMFIVRYTSLLGGSSYTEHVKNRLRERGIL